MNPKNIARLMVLVVVLAAGLAILTGNASLLLLGIVLILVTNAGAASWLKWHDEQQPAQRRN